MGTVGSYSALHEPSSDGALKTEEKTHKGSLVGVVDLSHSVDTIKELKWGKE